MRLGRNKVGAEGRKRLNSAKYDVSRERPLAGLADDENCAKGRQEPLPIDVAIAKERGEPAPGRPAGALPQNPLPQAVRAKLQLHRRGTPS